MNLFDSLKIGGRIAVLTGASGGIGREFASVLAQMGAEIYLVDRNQKALEEMSENLRDAWGNSCHAVACDLESQSSRQELIDVLSSRHTQIDILVNNAAFVGTTDIEGWAVRFEDQTLDSWRRAFEVNLTAVFHLTQALAPLLEASRNGSVINMGSIYAKNGPDWSLYAGTNMGNPAAYSASKGGLLQLTRWLSTTLAPHTRVNSISPGGVFRGQDPQFVRRYVSKVPLGRMATESDLVGIMAYLASDLSSYVTGQDFAIDGGWCIS